MAAAWEVPRRPRGIAIARGFQRAVGLGGIADVRQLGMDGLPGPGPGLEVGGGVRDIGGRGGSHLILGQARSSEGRSLTQPIGVPGWMQCARGLATMVDRRVDPMRR